VSKRESHDSSDFYDRFAPLQQDRSGFPAKPETVDKLILGDSRSMREINDDSVALVVTSPPYYAGKEYELELGEGGVPATYIEYLTLLRDVFQECWRVLEPGGRIAVNVANLGRRPYRSLSADVTRILQDDIGFLMRGEVLWIKAEGASGSCAWGSFQSAANPVLRDLSERVIIASKLRLDRALDRKKREALGFPFENSISKEEFMEATLDTWKIRPESAKKVGHPAPFPIDLPRRLIELYTYKGDLVLDPFVGAGTTAVAAVRTDRRYVGYDLDSTYIDLAAARVASEE
jgi:modification methylase